ncbi:MAG: hypothetical protein ACRD1X_02505 [Vicinamibacteria bacterium]
MSPIAKRLFPLGRWCVAAIFVAATSWVMLLGTLRSDRLNVDIGPGDADYTQGLSDFWRFDGERTWREMGRRARIHFPVTLSGPGQLTLSVAQPESWPIRLRAEFDDGSSRELILSPSSDFQELRLDLPESRVRSDVRLRTDTEDGTPGRLRLDRVRWTGRRTRPQAGLAAQSAALWVLSLLALGAAGLSLRWSITGSLVIGGAVAALGLQDPFASVHLLRKGAAVAILGLPVVLILRWLTRRSTPAFRSLVYGAFLLKAFLVLHPAFYFTDLPIHETLLELVYHRGIVDFWTRLPEYQTAHNLGVAPVAGVYQAFPYPAAFYLVAHLGNSAYHAPALWLKMGGALVSALALLPLGFLARRLSPERHVDLAAGAVYLLVPAYTRSLLLLELSALLGHLMDLVVVAYLARISLDLVPTRRTVTVAALIAASLAAYTAGFIHQGLFVASLLLLAPLLGGLDRSSAFRLAAAGLVGATVGLLTYHPDTISNVFLATLPAGAEDSSGVAISLTSRFVSAGARALEFLGGPLLALGTLGLALWFRRVSDSSLRLLVAAWALSGAVAYALRYYFLDLLHFQKELYWVGALLAVTTGVMVVGSARRGRRGAFVAAAILVAVAVGGFLAFWEMAPRFYERYAFF